MDKVNGEISGFTLPNNVTSKNVKSLVIDAGRNLWISTFRGGLDLYDSRQNKAINYKHSKKDSCSLLVDDIRKTVLEGTRVCGYRISITSLKYPIFLSAASRSPISVSIAYTITPTCSTS